MELTLTTEQQDLLINILEQRKRELMKEISHTDNREFRERLRRNERLLEDVLTRLAVGVVC